MEHFFLKLSRKAQKDIEKLTPKLKKKCFLALSEVISKNPYLGKKLNGDLEGDYSYRLSRKDRILYSIKKEKREIYVKRVRTHYGE